MTRGPSIPVSEMRIQGRKCRRGVLRPLSSPRSWNDRRFLCAKGGTPDVIGVRRFGADVPSPTPTFRDSECGTGTGTTNGGSPTLTGSDSFVLRRESYRLNPHPEIWITGYSPFTGFNEKGHECHDLPNCPVSSTRTPKKKNIKVTYKNHINNTFKYYINRN